MSLPTPTDDAVSTAPDESIPDASTPANKQEHWPVVLVRYGRIPEVARFGLPDGLSGRRGDHVVIASPRGQLIGEVLEHLRRDPNPTADGQPREEPETTGAVERLATKADLERQAGLDAQADAAFIDWAERIQDWGIELELLDVECTLDERTTLYVLNDRGAEPTKLALRAVTEHLGLVDVQPVTADGVVPPQGGGGCGSCGSH